MFYSLCCTGFRQNEKKCPGIGHFSVIIKNTTLKIRRVPFNSLSISATVTRFPGELVEPPPLCMWGLHKTLLPARVSHLPLQSTGGTGIFDIPLFHYPWYNSGEFLNTLRFSLTQLIFFYFFI